MATSVLDRLMAVIEDRKVNPGQRSYTATLFAAGLPKMAEKVVEEAAEAVEAAAEPGEDGRQHLIRESADVVFHLLVMMAHRDVTWTDVEDELSRRFGISGLDEKESRG